MPNPHPGGPGRCIYIPQRQGGYKHYTVEIIERTFCLIKFISTCRIYFPLSVLEFRNGCSIVVTLFLRVEVAATVLINVVYISWVMSPLQWLNFPSAYMAFGPRNAHYIPLSMSPHKRTVVSRAQIPCRVTSPECVLWQHWWQLGLTGRHSHLSLFF
jgi:hypothetical protein